MKSYEMKNRPAKIIKISGEMEGREIASLKKSLEDAAAFPEIIIDLSDANFLNSSFVAVLIQIKDCKADLFAKIKLVNPNELVRAMLEISPLSQACPVEMIFPTAW